MKFKKFLLAGDVELVPEVIDQAVKVSNAIAKKYIMRLIGNRTITCCGLLML